MTKPNFGAFCREDRQAPNGPDVFREYPCVQSGHSTFLAPGFTLNLTFADETSCSALISEHIYFLILTHPRPEEFATLPRAYTRKTTAAMIALPCEDRAAIDPMANAALAAGGSEPKPADDHGFMYTRTFHDLDGNVFEPFWIDRSANQPKFAN